MSLLAVLCALLIEQIRPLAPVHPVRRVTTAWLRWCGDQFHAVALPQVWVAWSVAVLVPTVASWMAFAFLWRVHGVLGFAWTVGLLYLSLGLRQVSDHYTHIRVALARGDEPAARSELARWRDVASTMLPRAELLRQVIEHAALAAHRQVFGVLFWFLAGAVLGLGPVGAVLYHLSERAAQRWGPQGQDVGGTTQAALGRFSLAAFDRIDIVPAHITAFGFAVVGSFEDAIDGWRHHAGLWPQRHDGVILAATAGAMGVRLGGPPPGWAATGMEEPSDHPSDHRSEDSQAQGAGPADAARSSGHASANQAASDEVAPAAGTPGVTPTYLHLRSLIGLVWRSLLLWLLLLALLTMARVVG